MDFCFSKVGIWNCKGKPGLFYFPQLYFSWPFFNSTCLFFVVALILYGFKQTCVPIAGNHNYKLKHMLVMTDSQLALWLVGGQLIICVHVLSNTQDWDFIEWRTCGLFIFLYNIASCRAWYFASIQWINAQSSYEEDQVTWEDLAISLSNKGTQRGGLGGTQIISWMMLNSNLLYIPLLKYRIRVNSDWLHGSLVTPPCYFST